MSENLYRTTGTFIPDKLIADNRIPLTEKGLTIAKGEGMLKRGTLMGIGADGKYRRTDTEVSVEKGEGEDAVTETTVIGADCILTDDVDATSSDAVATAYVTGSFNRAAVILSEGKNIAAHETELRKLGIFLKAVQDYQEGE